MRVKAKSGAHSLQRVEIPKKNAVQTYFLFKYVWNDIKAKNRAGPSRSAKFVWTKNVVSKESKIVA